MGETVKACFKCHRVLPLDEFYRHKAMADGHLGKCKRCTKDDARLGRATRQGQLAAYERERNQRPNRRAAKADYTRRARASHPEKKAARDAVARALRSGQLARKPCEHCGARENIHAHHEDYACPLDVVWLCVRCHRAVHRRRAA